MKLRTGTHVAIFSLAFILPQIVFFILETYVWNTSSQTLFQLPLKTEQDKEFFVMLSESIQPTLDMTTLQIFISNTIVSFVIWVAVYCMYLIFFRKDENKNDQTASLTFKMAYFACFFFFLKEGIRVGISVIDFYYSVRVPYLPATLTLILPHAIFEFMAFILISIFALNWLKGNLYQHRDKFIWPKPMVIIAPLILVLASALVETTVTPFIFKAYVSYCI